MVSTAELLVVDASVAVKWHLPDEPDADIALLLLDQFTAAQVQLVAPQHIRAEVPSAITVATRGRQARITAAQGTAAISEFLALGLPTQDDDALIAAAYATAQQVGCAFYDGLYLALAERLGSRFILADDRFHVLIRHLPFVVWLADYERTA
jgi:predicted nucleic acid-binding protein